MQEIKEDAIIMVVKQQNILCGLNLEDENANNPNQLLHRTIYLENMPTCHFFQSLSMIGITGTELLYGTFLFIPSLLEGSTRQQLGTPGNIYGCGMYIWNIENTCLGWKSKGRRQKHRQDPHAAQQEPKGKFHIVPIRPKTDMCLSLQNPSCLKLCSANTELGRVWNQDHVKS